MFKTFEIWVNGVYRFRMTAVSAHAAYKSAVGRTGLKPGTTVQVTEVP